MALKATRRAGFGLAALVFLCSSPASTLLAQRPYRIGPPPGWVKPVHADSMPLRPEGSVTNGYQVLLVDRQESVSASGVERFKRVSYRLLDQSAVEERSQLEFSFDPTYEQLTLHSVTVTRDGHAVDQLHTGQIRVLNRETEMDYHVFDGTLSVVLVLEDVKPGDVVEYSFTRRGNNPVFAGHYAASILLEDDVPTAVSQFRLLWPADRPLFVRPHQSSIEPTVRTLGSQREYLWAVHDVPAKVVDANLPPWYDAFAWVQLSDFASWGKVAAWGDSLFAAPGPVPGPLQAKIAAIRSANPSSEARVLAALRYVQDEVRYLGVEIGVNSHQPYPVATVLRRGYGDCKDKVQLLVTMLRALGFEARPALVSTSYRGHFDEVQPTASQFDHAIVHAEVDGEWYWLDPTAQLQGGDLRSVAAQFGAALVLGGGGDSLTPMPRIAAADPLTEVTVSFDLPPVGKPATMRVETDYRGRSANDMRRNTRGVSSTQLQRDYTKFYAESYPSIRAEAVPEIEDFPATNVIHSVERYVIPEFWHRSTEDSGFVGTLDPADLYSVIPSVTGTGRTMPLSVRHPVHFRYSVTAKLEQGWGIAPKTDSIETVAMRFVREISVDGRALTLRYEYESLADHVDPAAAADHLEKLSRARRLLGYSVMPPDTTATREWTNPRELNWTVLLLALVTGGVSLFGAIRIQRAPPPAWPAGPTAAGPGADPGPEGLGGWLLLAGIGVCLSPILLLVATFKDGGTYSASSWAQYTSPGGSGYHPFWAPVLLFELLSKIALVVFTLLLVWQYFHRQRWFPALFVMVSTSRVAVDWIDALLARVLPAVQAKGGIEWAPLLRNTLTVALWVGYMMRSKRVRNTFVK